jgi:Tol biopolymer transport system component
MTLEPGVKLGPYEIVASVGAGGMGEVYRARDTRLDRSVAVKVLPAHLSAAPELRQRFEREARAISSLSHPHICALYDVGHQDGIDYLVMEFLEGESLAARLEKGPLPVDQVLRFGIQITDALDKAHRQGLVHRDLKPGNIMLTPSGAKLLDFGLAKATAALVPGSGLSNLATVSTPVTAQGTLVGTFQYMSPEQVEGKEADARSDIFSFGAVLYEMLTGRRAFQGKSQLSVASAILEKDPEPATQAQPMTPPALDRAVRKSLAKDPEERWQTARDLMLELRWVAEAGTQIGAPAVVVSRRKTRELAAWALAGVALVSAAAFGAAWYRASRAEVQTFRSFLPPPEKTTYGTSWGWGGVSPDGRRIVFGVIPTEASFPLWMRQLDALAGQPLAGTERGAYPFWSGDSRWIGFFSDGKLRKISATGGPAITVCDAPSGRGGTWNRDGVIVFATRASGGLHRVSAEGGASTPLTQAAPEESHRWPYFLPDGKRFLFLALGGGEAQGGTIYVGSLDPGEKPKPVLQARSSVAYANGHILFVREGSLMAQPFDLGKLATTGDAFPVAEKVALSESTGRAGFFVSENGVLTYFTGEALSGSRLGWFNRTGAEVSSLPEQLAYRPFRISPDDRWAAVTIQDAAGGNWDLWLLDLARGVRTRFTSDAARDRFPVWSPDGKQIVFSSSRKGGPDDLYIKPASGLTMEEALLEGSGDKRPEDWSPDGRFLLYTTASGTQTRDDLWLLPMTGERKPVAFVRTEFNESHGRFSPDGRWVAFASNEGGRDDIYVVPFPGPGPKVRVSTGGGREPYWSRDGKEIFFRTPDYSKMMVAQVAARGAQFEVVTVKPLFDLRSVRGPSWVYSVTRDGRFLVNTSVEVVSADPITLVVNWHANLKK